MYDLAIVIPVFNSKSYISALLNSIKLQQTNYKFQVVFIDDGSSDGTVEYIENENWSSLKNDIKVLRQTHMKQAVARNFGLNNINSKFVCFIDSDDNISLRYVEEMVNAARKNPDYLNVFPINKLINNKKENEVPEVNGALTERLITDFLVKNNESDVGLWNKVFDVSVLRNNNILFENQNFFEDSLFVFKYILKTKGIKVHTLSIYLLKKRDGSTTREYRPELRNLANGYIQKVNIIINNNNIHVSKIDLNAFDFRTKLFVLHRNIASGQVKNKKEIGQVLGTSRKLTLLTSRLRLKYKFAFLLIKIMPLVYLKLYGRKE